jgi:cytochrome c556
MKKTVVAAALLAIASTAITQAVAQDAPFGMEIKARQGLMAYRAVNIGILGAMAKGEVEYDAAKAQAAADALVANSKIDQSMLWPPGSDNSANPASTAAASGWAEGSNVGELEANYAKAAEAMAAAAGTDLASLQGAMEGLGGSCGACHKAHRVPAN